MRISDKLAGIPAYNPGDATCDVVLNANESFLAPSDDLRQALLNVCKNAELNRYPDPLASELCQRFAEYYDLQGAAIVCGNGSDELIQLLYSCLVAAGDKVLTLQPDFSMYSHYAMMGLVEEVSWQKGEGYVIDVDEVLACAKDNDVAMILFSNPCNPTGVGLSRAEVLRLVEGFDGLVVVDEAYMDFWDQSVLNDVATHDNLIVLRTASKAIALASLRVGFAVMNERLAHLMWAGKSPYNVGRLVQAMAVEVFAAKDELAANTRTLKDSITALTAGVRPIIAEADDIRLYPSCTNFIFMETPRADVIADKLVAAGILVRQFKKPNALRVCCGTEAENAAFLEAFRQAVREG